MEDDMKMNKRGQALVEMAIVIILLSLLVFGIFQFGWFMYIKNTLNNAARAGARAAVVTPSLPTNSHPAYDYGSFSSQSTTDAIQQTIYNSLSYVSKSNVKADITDNNTGNTTAVSGDTITVSVTLNNVKPFVSKLIGLNFLPADTQHAGAYLITGTASMRYE